MDHHPHSENKSSGTTVMLVWVLTGMIIVGAAFFLVPSGGLWTSLNAAGLVAALYLVALVFTIIRKPLRLFPRIATALVALAMLGGTAFAWLDLQNKVCQQIDLRRAQGVVNARGRIIYTLSQNLLGTLEQYYRSTGHHRETLRDIFLRKNGNVEVGKAMSMKTMQPYPPQTVYVETLKSDSVVLIGLVTSSAGREQAFKNIDGRTGLVQEKLILTPNGLIHESQN
jgi:hypothetical protein